MIWMKRSKKAKPSPFDQKVPERPGYITDPMRTPRFVIKFEPEMKPGTVVKIKSLDIDNTPPCNFTPEQLQKMVQVLHNHNVW